MKFIAEFADGSVIKQDKDVSTIDPKRSRYFDVLKSKQKLTKFTLERFLDKWSIDLTTGIFEHNGVKFQLEENPLGGKIEFFRQHQQDATASYQADAKGNFTFQDIQEAGHRIVYFLGYKVGKKKYLVGIK